ncbi:hypothetical protein T03_17103 [Trichinella britovi]|uniref:Uncharacterized protein n=1 Tax=Trichinella britovi TaxID=45882 RepID=A0A0V1DAH9_TRIBR|nr:hypothetical protein T03_17103 [Trichinella britovi]KRZ92522.1 hypothetical protein T08_10846 [Trichinella sp. T8]
MQDNTQVMQMIYEQVKPIGIYNLPLKKRFSLSTSLTLCFTVWTRFCKYPKTNNGFQRKLLHSSPRKG